MKKIMKEKIPRVTKMTFEELVECIQNGKPFKCNKTTIQPKKRNVMYPCHSCYSGMALNEIRMNVRRLLCKACHQADTNIKYNMSHYLEM